MNTYDTLVAQLVKLVAGDGFITQLKVLSDYLIEREDERGLWLAHTTSTTLFVEPPEPTLRLLRMGGFA